MSKANVIRPYVEKTVAELLGTEHLEVLPDGTIPIGIKHTVMYVLLTDTDPPNLRVFAPVVKDVNKTPELLERLNELNSQTMRGRLFWVDGQIIIATDLLATDLDRDEVGNALQFVGSSAAIYQDEFSKSFGGSLVSPEEGRPDGAGEGAGSSAPPQNTADPNTLGTNTNADASSPDEAQTTAAGSGTGKPGDPDKDGFSAGYI